MAFLRPNSVFTVTSDVDGFRSVLVNYYFVRVAPGSNEWVLIDAGLRGGGRRIMREAARRFGAHNPPRAILLTHGHFDHVGALPWLLRRWRVPVYAHQHELPFLHRYEPYPAPDPTVGGGLLALSSVLFPRWVAPFEAEVQPLNSDGSVPHLPDWQWIPAPGHTPGQVAFWRPADRLLLSADALITTRQESLFAVLRQIPEMRPPPAYFTPDWRRAYDALLRLRSLRPAIVASGHGLPVYGDFLTRGLDQLLANFPSRGLPRHGRYVPAIRRTA
jgi:glyoxylase-like metal-dependent hydrolase (beta-lactamase superfamily II)